MGRVRSSVQFVACFLLHLCLIQVARAEFGVTDQPLIGDFSQLNAATFTDGQLQNVLRRAITHPGGVAYYRLLTTVAPGNRIAMVRQDIETISIQQRTQMLQNILTQTPPRSIYWDNLFLLWNSYMPDSEGVDVGRIRQLAIDLQNLDRTGEWRYADLRQEVHNFPSALLVPQLEAELHRAEADVRSAGAAAPPDLQQRTRLLGELLNLERQFWHGVGLTPDRLRGELEIFQIPQAQMAGYRESDPPFERAEALVAVREKLKNEIGTSQHSVGELMELDRPLTQTEANELVTFLTLDRKISNETQRMLSQIDTRQMASGPRGLGLLAKVLQLENLLPPDRAEEITFLSNDLKRNFDRIRRILAQPITNLQSRFTAMNTHMLTVQPTLPTQRRGNQNQIPSVADTIAGGRVLALGDNEVRQSPLFPIGNLAQAALREASPPATFVADGVLATHKLKDFDLVLPFTKPVDGKVIVVRNEKDIERVTALAADQVNVIMLKLVPFDVELPPVGLLVTVDPALNQASHMALLAKSGDIGHINVTDSSHSAFIRYLIAHEDRDVRVAIEGTDKPQVKVDNIETIAAARGQAKREQVKLETNINETHPDPVPLEELNELERRLGNHLTGGKGKGLALLQEEIAKEPGLAEFIKIPKNVELGYGFFMDWFQQIGLRDEWEKAVNSPAVSDNWGKVMERITKNALLPRKLEAIVRAMGGREQLALGWHVRSNSNSEDGGFNAAGVNRSIPNITDEKELAAAVPDVFSATYLTKARAWWERIFSNPKNVRSMVLLTQTIPSTHSSVVVVAADGNHYSVDSLPGVGENVVGGTAIAEQLVYQINPKSGKVEQITTVQPASAFQLKYWVERAGKREVESRAVSYQGPVLNSVQREKASQLVGKVRAVANRIPQFHGKPLDLELAWVNDSPYLVQIRVAPREPAQVARFTPTPRTSHRPSTGFHHASPEKIAESIIDNLHSGRPLVGKPVTSLTWPRNRSMVKLVKEVASSVKDFSMSGRSNQTSMKLPIGVSCSAEGPG